MYILYLHIIPQIKNYCSGLSPNYAEACPSALTSLYVGGHHHQRPLARRGDRYYHEEAEQDVVSY
jgi:hypothetical protein